MSRFSLTELSRGSGAVVEAAFKGPVDITDRGKRKFVLVTAEMFDRLTEANRRVRHVDDLTDEGSAFYITALSDDPA
jgi:prevent-host-death family protein